MTRFKKLSKHIVQKLRLEKNSLIVDIGCNDATLLSHFSELGMRILGFDPGSINGDLCRQKNVNVCQASWKRFFPGGSVTSVVSYCMYPDHGDRHTEAELWEAAPYLFT